METSFIKTSNCKLSLSCRERERSNIYHLCPHGFRIRKQSQAKRSSWLLLKQQINFPRSLEALCVSIRTSMELLFVLHPQPTPWRTLGCSRFSTSKSDAAIHLKEITNEKKWSPWIHWMFETDVALDELGSEVVLRIRRKRWTESKVSHDVVCAVTKIKHTFFYFLEHLVNVIYENKDFLYIISILDMFHYTIASLDILGLSNGFKFYK